MQRLASPITSLKSDYDVIVIGSGYGGSITASRMARAGKKICVLERGKEFQPGEYPDQLSEANHEMQIDLPGIHIGKKTGLFDLRVNDDINVLQGCGLGGTSLINANVGIEPEPKIFEDACWPKELRDDKELLQKSFVAVHEMLRTNTIPTSYPVPAKSKALKLAAEKTGAKNNWRLAPLFVNFDVDGPNHVGVEQKPCIGCGDCCTGCNYSAKNTMIMNYLPDAKNHGAEIYTCINVRFVEKQEGKWRVHFNLIQTGEEKFNAPTDFISADVVVLAAGSLGSTELLLRSKQNGFTCSDMVGKKFTGNGDFLGFGYNNDERANSIGTGSKLPDKNDPVGPNMTSIIDLRNNDDPNGMAILEGVVPSIISGAFSTMITAAASVEGRDTDSGITDWLKEKARIAESIVRGPYHGALNNTMIFLVIANDDDNGKMFLKDDRLRIDWAKAGEQPIFEKINERLYELTKALGGTYTKNPAWTNLFSKQLTTVHPLGGCIIGENSKQGVVNHKGQVFTGADDNSVYDSLYICDGAIIPRPLSINPSLTISALAERNCFYMAKDRGWNFNYDFPVVVTSTEKELKPGIEFTQKMTGYIASPGGNEDFEKCFEIGKAASQTCEFVLSIVSDDIESLINNPKHNAGIIGTISAPLLSPEPMTVTGGVFNLFEKNPNDKNTLLVKYTLPVSSQNGKQYFLIGFKSIHDDPGFDSWSDNTTLFTTIYEGNDPNGKILAKGILKIKFTDFAKQLTTIKILNAKNSGERLKWKSRFGKYFAGALAETYF